MEKYKLIIGFCSYILCSAIGLTLIKYGVSKKFGISFENFELRILLSYFTIFGIILYIISFLLSLTLMKNMNLSYFYPISAGAIFIMVCVFGVLFLHEKMNAIQIIGCGVILLGIFLLNLK